MNANLSRRGKIRVSAFVLALILILTAATVTNYVSASNYKRRLEDTYVRSLRELSSYMTNISTTLNKQIYATTPAQFSELSSRLWKEAGSAKTALSSLPITELELGTTYKFLSQVGDYSMSVSKQNMSSGSMSGDSAENTQGLLDYSRLLNNHVNDLIGMLARGELDMDKLEKRNDVFGSEGAQERQTPEGEAPGADADLLGFQEMEDSSVGYPKLIYDGPFSDHMLERTPLMLEDEKEVDEKTAAAEAAKVTGINDFKLEQTENSKLPSYIFSSGDLTVAISKAGGKLVYLINGREIGNPVIRPADTVKIAADYLASIGITEIKESYYEGANGICTVNFAYYPDGVICYTDLIKVGVAMDDGSIVSVDARGYLTNHRPRTIAPTVITEEEARAKVSGLLTVENVRLALIPSSGMNEWLTYEVRCLNAAGEHVLVYIDVTTGEERQILLLIESDEGVLTV